MLNREAIFQLQFFFQADCVETRAQSKGSVDLTHQNSFLF